LAAGSVKIASLEGRIIKNAGCLHPGIYVPPAIRPRHTSVIPNGERYRVPRLMDLLSELSARLENLGVRL
jgi:hypothetical protein